MLHSLVLLLLPIWYLRTFLVDTVCLGNGARCDVTALHKASKAANTKISFLNARVAMQHPGFDFSSAEFNGEAPNARTFMGGHSES